MAIRRVALIFDHRSRPETTGVHCRRALGRLVEVEHVLPEELGQLPRTGFDLYLNVDDGLDYRLPDDLHPRAWWAIDTHLGYERCRAKAIGCDFAFAAQRDGAEALRRDGVAATWLPLACDPDLHRPHDVPKQYDVAFIGNVFPGPREDLLRRLVRRFPRALVTQLYFEAMAEGYSASKLAFNRSLRDDVNMRVFEAVACGTLLLTDDLAHNGQAELLRDGVHLATYRDGDDLLDKAAYYLGRNDLREKIAAQGRAEAHSRHTYRHRMEQILAAVEAGDSRLVSVPFATPSGPDRSYYEHARPELLALVPESARSVLDVGCGAGRLGEAIKARQGAEVTGLERDPEAARQAESRLDRVIVGDVEASPPDFPPGSFDAVVCGDVLEHLRDPDALLRRVRAWLRPGGCLVASVPNVRHHSVVGSLLEGNWTYESAGLLDRDHVRFFTRREVEKLVARAGFALRDWRIVPGPGYDEWAEGGRRGEVRVGRLRVAGLSPADAEEFYAYQYLLVATPEELPDRGVTSIVLVTHGQLGYTRECLESIRRLTDEPVELIVVDNASPDGTAEYVRSLRGVRLVANAENRGFPAAANQGIAAATGRQVLLLNNDTLATTGWLSRMLRALDSDPAIGLVGPCSNRVSGCQQVEATYDDLAGLDGFAWDRGRDHDGAIEDVDRLIGFCLLIRRAVIDAIGVLDERFGVGCFEDDDYTRRALAAGWRAVIARDAFVHHHGGRTFVGSGADFGAIMRENEAKYRAKWGDGEPSQAASPPVLRPPARRAPAAGPAELEVAAAPRGGLLLRRKHVRLSLCMIVRDNAGTLGPCLESIRPWVDELVIVDTGSTDATPRIAEDHGARLFHFPWCDDFSAARNESLRHARGEWLFWMDSDDTITPECGRGLRDVAYGEHDEGVLGYVVQVHCPGSGEEGVHDVTVVDHVKLFRNRPDLRFDGRIHEQILPAIRRADGEVAWTELYVVHSGSDRSVEGQARKRQRDLALLHLELKERPEHPFTLFNLGMTYADCGRHEEAVEHLRRGIARSHPDESHLRKAYALLVYSLMRLERLDEASDTCREGRRLFPEDAELRFRQGVLLQELGCPGEAARAYRDVLEVREARHFASVDPGIGGFKARQNLAVALTELGDHAGAEQQWRRIVAEVPGYRSGWRGLGESLLARGAAGEAEDLAAGLLRDGPLRAEGWLLRGKVAAAAGDEAAARRDLEAAVAERPDDPEPRQALCRLLFERGPAAEAEAALLDLAKRHPEDASAHHNLGTLRLRARRLGEAVGSFRESVRLRPKAAGTWHQLARALKDWGRSREAAGAWRVAAKLDPSDEVARHEVELAGRR